MFTDYTRMVYSRVQGERKKAQLLRLISGCKWIERKQQSVKPRVCECGGQCYPMHIYWHRQHGDWRVVSLLYATLFELYRQLENMLNQIWPYGIHTEIIDEISKSGPCDVLQRFNVHCRLIGGPQVAVYLKKKQNAETDWNRGIGVYMGH